MLSLRLLAARWCAVILVALTASPAIAADPVVVQVEEDWELVIATPEAGNTAPQVTCAISPRSQLDSLVRDDRIQSQNGSQLCDRRYSSANLVRRLQLESPRYGQ